MYSESDTQDDKLDLKSAWRLCSIPIAIALTVLLLIILFGDKGFGIESYIEIQTELFISANSWLSAWPWFWLNLTDLGDASVFLALLSFLIIWKPQTWAALLCAIPLCTLFSVFGKHWFSVPRPAAVLPHEQFHIIGETLMAHNSLPSGHAITVFAIVTVVSYFFVRTQNSRAKVMLTGTLIAGVITLSRVAIGAHWPLDILVGSCLGFIGGISGILLSQRCALAWSKLPVKHRLMQILAGNIMFFWGVLLIQAAWENREHATILPWMAAMVAILVACKIVFVPNRITMSGEVRKLDPKSLRP